MKSKKNKKTLDEIHDIRRKSSNCLREIIEILKEIKEILDGNNETLKKTMNSQGNS